MDDIGIIDGYINLDWFLDCQCGVRYRLFV